MHPSDEKPVQLLNHLLQLNQTRYSGFQQAEKQTDVSVLQVMFERFTDTSALCSEELCQQIYKLGGRPRIWRLRGPFDTAWEQINAALLHDDHVELLNACYCEEQMCYKQYEYFLRNHEQLLNTEMRELFLKHRLRLFADHQTVFNLRSVLLQAA